jgi:hypothetical protein
MRNDSFESTTAERIAANDERFRNEQPQARADASPRAVPFLCECADPMCRKSVSLTLDEYAQVRAKPTHYLNAKGHQTITGSIALVVREIAGCVVVERSSRARTAF